MEPRSYALRVDSLPPEPPGKPMRDPEDSADGGLPSGVGDEEQRCKDLVFFFLHCFKSSCRLPQPVNWVWQSHSLVVDPVVFCVLYCGLLSIM